MTDILEPSNAEQAEWPDTTRRYVEALRAALDAAEARAVGVTDAAKDVLVERQRQVSVEGWTPERDDTHTDGQIALAAGAYASFAGMSARHRLASRCPYPTWPWEAMWWKPTDRRRDLVKAGALILAEIERLDRSAIRTWRE